MSRTRVLVTGMGGLIGGVMRRGLEGPDGLVALTRRGLYGWSKVCGETLGRHYADRHGLSVLCVRIGAVVAEDRPTTPRHFSVWCSQRDVAQVLEKCVTAPPQLHYEIFYAVSNNRRNYRDFSHARAVLGYEPRDSADAFAR